jgi:catechol 2,3-dioxygenase-like lactoylglutathione lyase family enzyme
MTPPLLRALRAVTLAVAGVPAVARHLRALLGYVELDHDADSVLLGAPGVGRGLIRLVSGPDGAAPAGLAPRWGAVEVVVADAHAVYRAADEQELQILAGPTDVDLSEYGSNVHRCVIVALPGGATIACTQAITRPRGREFTPVSGRSGPVFAAHLRTGDAGAALDFYRDVLGMVAFFDGTWSGGFFHQLWRMPAGPGLRMVLLKGDAPGTGLGSIELQGHDPAMLDPGTRDSVLSATFTATDLARVEDAARAASMAVRTDGPALCVSGPAGETLRVVPDGAPLPVT